MTPASTCRRKTSRAVRSASVDEDARGTVLAMCGCDSSQRAHRDRGRQRSRRRALGAAENAASGRCRSEWLPGSLARGGSSVFDVGGSWRGVVKTHLRPGPVALKSVPGAKRMMFRFRDRVLWFAVARAAGPGSERFCGCSCPTSIAEVGEEHLVRLLRAVERRFARSG
jgi:hypothetical protein